MNNKLIFLFGCAGAGKSYLAKYLSDNYGYFYYEGDEDITPAMKEAISLKKHFTDDMRQDFVEVVAAKITELQKNHNKIVIAQGLYKNVHRRYLLGQIPEMKFVWVRASDKTIQERLKSRHGIKVDEEYARKIKLNFEEPDMDVLEIFNDGIDVDVNLKKVVDS